MKIEKKIYSKPFQRILDGEKRFEFRIADFECKPGDIFVLREIDTKRNYTGRVLEKKVTAVTKTKNLNFFSKEDIEKYGYQIISI